VGRRDRPLQVSSIDDLAAHGDIVNNSRAQVSDPLALTPAAHVLVAGEHMAPACLRQPLGRVGEMTEQLRAGRPLVVPGVLADLVDAVLAERQRVDAVVRRGGVQANERISIHPVTARSLAPVYHRHLNVRLDHERVGEGEAARTRSHNQIISTHGHVLSPAPGRKRGAPFGRGDNSRGGAS
jgi:hypothetical protein